jgi:hypothetical protein
MHGFRHGGRAADSRFIKVGIRRYPRQMMAKQAKTSNAPQY